MTKTQSRDFTAKTVQAAVDEGLHQLGLSRDQIEVEVLHEGSRGILGIGATDVIVRLTTRLAPPPATPAPTDSPEAIEASEKHEQPAAAMPPAPVPAPEQQPTMSTSPETVQAEESQPDIDPQEDDPELADLAYDLLSQMLQLLNIQAEIEISWPDNPEDNDQPLHLNVIGADLGVLIGRNGETLASIQYLIRLMVNQELHRWTNIVVDIDGYKQRREEQLSQLAHRMADQVVASGRPASLEPMPPGERRLVHIALRDHEHVYTASTGEDSRRKVQILPR